MKPYYDDGKGIVIYHGDCLEIMSHLKSSSIDFVLTDLPYGCTASKWDSKINFEELWDSYRHLLKENTTLCFTASQPFTSQLVVSKLEWFRHEWIWKKNRSSNFLNANRQPLKIHESVLIFSENAPRYFPQKTNGHEPIKKAHRKSNSSELYRSHRDSINNFGSTKRYPKTIIEIKSVDNISKERFHSTQKPVALFEYFIRTYTQPLDVVLDNCAGSGTTAIACRNAGRKCVLIEIDEKYCEISALRISKELL